MKTDEEILNKTMQLALGRIFKLCSRPYKEGDIQDYENAKYAFIEAAEGLGLNLPVAVRPYRQGTNFGNNISVDA